jgi:hypothetical protein
MHRRVEKERVRPCTYHVREAHRKVRIVAQQWAHAASDLNVLKPSDWFYSSRLWLAAARLVRIAPIVTRALVHERDASGGKLALHFRIRQSKGVRARQPAQRSIATKHKAVARRTSKERHEDSLRIDGMQEPAELMADASEAEGARFAREADASPRGRVHDAT